jgi:PleD family two-component response regulator
MASHGAAALEIALAHKPAAMVVQAALPLIDGTRLAQILQTNPHTCSMRMLFIDDAGVEDAKTPLGRMIPGQADPEVIARFIEALLRDKGPDFPDAGVPVHAPHRASRASSRRSRCRS